MRWQSLVFLLSLWHVANSENILILEELDSKESHAWFKVITTALVSRGHNITVVGTIEDISETNLHYIYMNRFEEHQIRTYESDGWLSYFSFVRKDPISWFFQSVQHVTKLCSDLVKTSGWKQLLNYPDNFKFDLVIHDHVVGGCMLSFIQKFEKTQKYEKTPVIALTSFNDVVTMPLIAQMSMIPALSTYPALENYPTTFIGRIMNAFYFLLDGYLYIYEVTPKLTSIVRNTGSFINTKSMYELNQRTILYLMNYDPVMDGPRQLPPNVIGIGGLQATEPKPLTPEFYYVVHKLTIAMVSIDFRDYTKQFNDQYVYLMATRIFAEFPHVTFLWKINLIDPSLMRKNFPKNVILHPDLPENDILAQINTRLYITHGSLLSVERAFFHGVPVFGVPLNNRHIMNLNRCVEKGIGRYLPGGDFSIPNVMEILESMLLYNSYSYYDAAKKVSKVHRDQNETPLERAVWWIEWALRNPDVTHFTSRGKLLHFLEIESLDVVIPYAVVFLALSLACIYLFIRYILKPIDNKFGIWRSCSIFYHKVRDIFKRCLNALIPKCCRKLFRKARDTIMQVYHKIIPPT